MFLRNLSSVFKNLTCRIVQIPKSWKMPPENFFEPTEWTLNFPPPSQVRQRAFFDASHNIKLGPSDEVDKKKIYKNPEYYSYHPLSFYSIEEDINCKRCRRQPSPFKATPICANEKCPWIKKTLFSFSLNIIFNFLQHKLFHETLTGWIWKFKSWRFCFLIICQKNYTNLKNPNYANSKIIK